MGYEEYDPNIYETTRGDRMRFPDPPEDGKFVFYNLHLPGTNNSYGTPVGVVALLVHPEHLNFIARGIAIRSLHDKWDVREGRIRAAGRALRAYNKYYAGAGSPAMKLAIEFKHEHATHITALHDLGIFKSIVPVELTIREKKLLEKRGIINSFVEVEFVSGDGHSQNSG